MSDTPINKDKDAEDNKFIAAISYISILCLLGVFGKKDSPYVQHHAKQGLVLFIGEIILMFFAIIPVLGWLVYFFGMIAAIVFSILGFVNALNGKKWEMPVLGQYAKKLNF